MALFAALAAMLAGCGSEDESQRNPAAPVAPSTGAARLEKSLGDQLDKAASGLSGAGYGEEASNFELDFLTCEEAGASNYTCKAGVGGDTLLTYEVTLMATFP